LLAIRLGIGLPHGFLIRRQVRATSNHVWHCCRHPFLAFKSNFQTGAVGASSFRFSRSTGNSLVGFRDITEVGFGFIFTTGHDDQDRKGPKPDLLYPLIS
jgi:hypothetical protein